MPKLPEYMRNFIKSVPQDKTFVKQDRPSAWRNDLEWREPMAKDDVSTLSRFRKMSGEDQLAFLTRKVWGFMSHNNGNTWKERLDNWIKELATPNPERGLWAKRLRGVVKFMKLDFLFSYDFPIYRRFMNEDLREFLNLNENRTMEYGWEDVYKQKKWSETPSLYAAYHQYEVDVPVSPNNGRYNNAKFIHEDGREVIFNYKKERVNTHIDRGTFNYVPVKIPPIGNVPLYLMIPGAVAINGVKLVDTFSRHDVCDVRPWKELMQQEFSGKFPSNFDFGKDMRDYKTQRYLHGCAFVKNTEIWIKYFIVSEKDI
jgi:hypothetical protein